jgi:hypothetical protein
MSLDGSRVKSQKTSITVSALTRTVAAKFTPKDFDPCKDILFARIEGDSNILPAVFKASEYHQLQMAVPDFEISLNPVCDGVYVLEIKSDSFAHAVQVSGPGDDLVFEDNYFDLLPGSTHRIQVKSSQKVDAQELLVQSYVPRSVLSNQKVKISSVRSKINVKHPVPSLSETRTGDK